MTKRKVGAILIAIAIILFIIERVTTAISNVVGRIACGEVYLTPVAAVNGGGICGFNMDIYVVAFLLLLCIIGIILVIIPKKKTVARPTQDNTPLPTQDQTPPTTQQ